MPKSQEAPTFASLICTLRDRGLGAAWLQLVGELDFANRSRFERTLEEAQGGARLLVVDLRGLSFMDTAGVHALVDATAAARRGGRRLILIRPPAEVDRVFDLTGTRSAVELFDLDPGEPAVQVLPRLMQSRRGNA